MKRRFNLILSVQMFQDLKKMAKGFSWSMRMVAQIAIKILKIAVEGQRNGEELAIGKGENRKFILIPW